MFLEKITPAAFGFLALGIAALYYFGFRNRTRNWGNGKTFLFFMTPILAVVTYAIARYFIVYAPRFEQFKTHWSEYTSVTTQQPGEWYLRGKVLPIDTRENKVEVNVYYDLPDELRPVTPEEVSMVLWMDCVRAHEGNYSHGGEAYQWHCQVTLVDLVDGVVLGEASYDGSEPPITNSGSSDQTGSFPSDDIIATLEALPVK